MRRLCLLLVVCLGLADSALAVTHKGALGEQQAGTGSIWAYDQHSERAESQIRIRRIQHMLDQHGSLEGRRLLNAIEKRNAQR